MSGVQRFVAAIRGIRWRVVDIDSVRTAGESLEAEPEKKSAIFRSIGTAFAHSVFAPQLGRKELEHKNYDPDQRQRRHAA